MTIPETTPGLFVVFEGGDGVGKSTQVLELVTRLQNRRIEPVLTRQPGGTPIGAKLRKLLLDPGHPELTARTEALVYAADKAQHVEEVILPALVRGDVVVCDRYVDSMIAYQGAGRVLDLTEVEQVAHWATGGLRPRRSRTSANRTVLRPRALTSTVAPANTSSGWPTRIRDATSCWAPASRGRASPNGLRRRCSLCSVEPAPP